jgi:uncharacterized protein
VPCGSSVTGLRGGCRGRVARMTDRIDVTGTGTAQVRPDRLVARLGAEATGPDLPDVLAAAEAGSRAMADAFRGHGLADADLRTEGMSLGQHHDRHGDPAGFRAFLGLTLTLRDLATAGAVLGEVLAAGGDAARLLEVALAVSDPSAAEHTARELAVADARSQAEHLAALAGRPLGVVRRLSTAVSPGHPVAFAMVADGRRSGGALPVETGETTVTVSVQARFELG